MSFDWSLYLNLARELAGQETEPSDLEARLRSAISRAYYAAFQTARSVVGTGGLLTGRDSHNEIIDKFFEYDDVSKRQVGAELQRLKKARRMADYDNTIPNLPRLTEGTIMGAEEVLSKLKEF